jgi:hypothetical protein
MNGERRTARERQLTIAKFVEDVRSSMVIQLIKPYISNNTFSNAPGCAQVRDEEPLSKEGQRKERRSSQGGGASPTFQHLRRIFFGFLTQTEAVLLNS